MKLVDVDEWELDTDPDVTTTHAAAINYVMARSPEARARYREIHGEDWRPLGNGAELPDSQCAVTKR